MFGAIALESYFLWLQAKMLAAVRRLHVFWTSRSGYLSTMGEERDELIRRLGGVPVSDRDLSDADLMRMRIEYYARRGRLPPEIERIRDRRGASEVRSGGRAEPPAPDLTK